MSENSISLLQFSCDALYRRRICLSLIPRVLFVGSSSHKPIPCLALTFCRDHATIKHFATDVSGSIYKSPQLFLVRKAALASSFCDCPRRLRLPASNLSRSWPFQRLFQ